MGQVGTPGVALSGQMDRYAQVRQSSAAATPGKSRRGAAARGARRGPRVIAVVGAAGRRVADLLDDPADLGLDLREIRCVGLELPRVGARVDAEVLVPDPEA